MSHPRRRTASMIFVEHCAGCGARGRVLCRSCRFALLGPPVTTPSGVIAAVPFRGRARDVLLGLKYGNRRAVSRHLAGLLVNRLLAGGVDVDVVTWAPTSRARRRRRGFDQAEMVARTVARQLGVPCSRLLHRLDGAHQTGLARADRLRGAVFQARLVAGRRRVLVVDDVVTTGATLRHAAAALADAGACAVTCAAVAATPDGRSTGRLISGPWQQGAAHGEDTAGRRQPASRLDPVPGHAPARSA